MRLVVRSKVSTESRLALEESQARTGYTTQNVLQPGGCSCPWRCAGGCQHLHSQAGNPAGTGALPALLSWLTFALLCTAAFQTALVFTARSCWTCSSIKCQKTNLYKTWLNYFPFVCISPELPGLLTSVRGPGQQCLLESREGRRPSRSRATAWTSPASRGTAAAPRGSSVVPMRRLTRARPC